MKPNPTLDLFSTPDEAAIAATVNRPRIPRRSQHVHDHSVVAREQELPRLSKRAAAILKWVTENGPHTDRQIMHAMGFADMNSVRPRITELVDAALLFEVGDRIDPQTRKRVRIVSGAPS